jgi:hypothetical protein
MGQDGRMVVLSDRALSRATLARQHLLSRVDLDPLAMVEHLVGMQGQDAELPYFGLWSRLSRFERDDLTALLHSRAVVRGTLYRGTQHIMAADDYRWVRPLLQPMLDTWQRGTFGRHLAGVAPAELAAAARELIAGAVLTRMDLGRALAAQWPDADPQWLARSVQGLLPVLHPAPDGVWGHRGATPFALAEPHLGRPLAGRPQTDLVLRYLAAFGPASVADMQAWSRMTGLRPAFEELRPRLCTFRSAAGAELFDLPEAPRPGPDVPAPVRLLACFDNVLYGHADRSRIIAAEHRRHLLAEAMLIVDGVVRGFWKIKTGTLTVRLLAPLTAAEEKTVSEEGERLLTFAGGTDLRITEA